MQKRLPVLLALLLSTTGLVTTGAQNAPAPPAARTAAASGVPRVTATKYLLPNGLEVILSRKPGIPMVAVNLYYHVGPANEAKGRTGFAHLFEHMMFQHSKHVPEDTYF